MSWNEQLFLWTAAPIRRLPNFRGKVRALLGWHESLGLKSRHVAFDVTLHDPATFRTRLDLHAMHERMAYLMDGWEADCVRFLYRLYDHTGPFLDIGANIGLITLPMTALISQHRAIQPAQFSGPIAYCCEPAPANFASLTHGIQLNGWSDRIAPLQMGVGEMEKQVYLQVEGGSDMQSGTGTANIVGEAWTVTKDMIPLTITTLDSLSANGTIPKNVALVKIDVDGYDLFALMGARTFLRDARPLIFGEFHAKCLGWHGHTIQQVAELMNGVDYDLFVKRPENWTFEPLANPAAYVQDILLAPREKRSQVEFCLA